MNKKIWIFLIVVIVLIISGFLFIKTLDESFNTEVTFKDTITQQEADAMSQLILSYDGFAQAEYPAIGMAKVEGDYKPGKVNTVKRYVGCRYDIYSNTLELTNYSFYEFEIRPEYNKEVISQYSSSPDSFVIGTGETVLIPVLVGGGKLPPSKYSSVGTGDTSLLFGKMKSDEFWIYEPEYEKVRCGGFSWKKWCPKEIPCSWLVQDGKKPLKIIKIV